MHSILKKTFKSRHFSEALLTVEKLKKSSFIQTQLTSGQNSQMSVTARTAPGYFQRVPESDILWISGLGTRLNNRKLSRRRPTFCCSVHLLAGL